MTLHLLQHITLLLLLGEKKPFIRSALPQVTVRDAYTHKNPMASLYVAHAMLSSATAENAPHDARPGYGAFARPVSFFPRGNKLHDIRSVFARAAASQTRATVFWCLFLISLFA